MNEIVKQNDIFVSTLLNPEATSVDLLSNGINGSNTGFLDPETYKLSKFVLKAFTDDKGIFNTLAFNETYLKAADKFNDLQSVKSYEDLNDFVKYSENDLYASIHSNKEKKLYELEKVRNPFRESTGITSLFGKSESPYSKRELAQQHKVWDSKNEKWLDYTAEDQGFLGYKYLGRQSLVYATWDEDGTHFDKSLGREVEHRKGDWKTDDEGLYYTETVGNKLCYGKEYVAYSDILTKETDWLNKIDVFDSDDKHKSKFGTTMKAVAAIAPYMFPISREIWGGVTAIVGLSTVLPTFGKMMEGIATADKETAFTKLMNTLENYWSKFGSSHSDDALGSMINFETMAETVSDIFGQLYQMRAAASLSKLYGLQATKAQLKSFESFANKFGAQWELFVAKNPNVKFGDDTFFDMWKDLAEHTPEMKAIIDKLTKLSKSLSLGYMALTSSADVYSDALEHGYDRRTAGWAGIIATLGQYGIMRNNKMGDWFLDATTGYKADVSRNIMKKTLQPFYDQIGEGVDKIAKAATKEEKLSAFAKVFDTVYNKGIKNFGTFLKEGGEEYWKRSLIEGIEEVTEEGVMDATKAAFDFFSFLGLGKNSDTARFNAIDETFSKEGALRYFMNFIGGILGGALFEFQGKVVLPKMDAIFSGKQAPEMTYSIVKEVMNGNTEELLKEIDRMAKADSEVIEMPVSVNGEGANITSQSKQNTRGQAIAKTLKLVVKFVDGVVADNNIKLSDDQILTRAIRDKMILPLIEQSGVLDMMVQDFNKMATELVQNQGILEGMTNPEEDTKNDKKPKEEKDKDKKKDQQEETTSKVKVDETKEADIKKKIADSKKKLQSFLNGENAEEYMKIALQYLHPQIRQAVLGADKYSYTLAIYGKDYSSLPETGASLSKEQIDKEYIEWKDKADDITKFRQIGVKAYDQMQQDFSSAIFDFVESVYGDVRDEAMSEVFRDSMLTIGSNIKDESFKYRLERISKKLNNVGLPGVTLDDTLKIGDSVRKNIIDRLVNRSESFFEDMTDIVDKERRRLEKELPELLRQELGIDPNKVFDVTFYKNQFEEQLIQELNSLPIEKLTASTINSIAAKVFENYGIAFTKLIIENLPEGIDRKTAKIEVDKALVAYGFSPVASVEFKEDVPLDIAILSYVVPVTAPRLDVLLDENGNPYDDTIDLGDQVLEAYLDSKEVIDNEVVINTKLRVLKDLLKKYEEFKEILGRLTPNLPLDIDKKFETILSKGIDDGKRIWDVVEAWIDNTILDLNSNDINPEPEDIDDAKDNIKAIVKLISSVAIYEKAVLKASKKNPIFEAFRKFGMKVFDGDDIKIFNLLEQESQYMSKLPDISEYIRQGVTKEAIDNFLLKLNLLSAIIVGMEQAPLDLDHQFGYNVQMARWAEKWNGGKNKDKYKTIDTKSVERIEREIDILRNKLGFAKGLIELNTLSKWKQNVQIKESVDSWCLSKMLEVGSKLQVDGISVFPKLDEIDKRKSDEEKLAFIWHTIHSKIKELHKNGKSISYILDLLLGEKGFNFNKLEIFGSGLDSAPLTSDFKQMSEYDLFVYVVGNLATDQLKFYFKLQEILKLDSYKHIPFPSLEFAAREMYSFAKDSLNIHTEAVNWLYRDSPTQFNLKATQIFFANGIAGAGKTSAVMSLVAAMLGKQKVIIAAPNEKLVENLKKSLTTLSPWMADEVGLTKAQLLEKFFTEDAIKEMQEASGSKPKKNVVLVENPTEDGGVLREVSILDSYIKDIKKEDLPKYIFIDEVTHFNHVELIALDKAAQKYGIKIITSGDTLQKGALIGKEDSNIRDIFSFKSPALTISVRASTINKKENTDILQTSLRNIEKEYQVSFVSSSEKNLDEIVTRNLTGLKIKYYENPKTGKFDGDKFVEEITVLDILSIVAAARNDLGTIAIITSLDADGKIKDLEFKAKLDQAGLNEKDYVVYSAEDHSSRAVQGSEADYVIINEVPSEDFRDKNNAAKSLYTYLSRSIKGTLMRDKGRAFQQGLLIFNEKSSFTGKYETPGLDSQADLKLGRINVLQSIIDDNAYSYTEPKPKTESTSTESEEPKATSEGGVTTEKESEEVVPTRILGQIQDEINQGLERQEKADKTTSEKKDGEGRHLQENANPMEWVPDKLWGYTFYNRTGGRRDSLGNLLSTDDKTSMDLDGLFELPNIRINERVILGYVKFKNLISLYSDTNSEYFKAGMEDKDILYFFFRIMPSISDSTIEAKQLDDTKIFLLGDGETPGALRIDSNNYLFFKNYDRSTDLSVVTMENNPNANGQNSMVGFFGKRIYIENGEGGFALNQYITCGALPKASTLSRVNIKYDTYKAFLERAAKDLTSAGKPVIYRVPDSIKITPIKGLNIHKLDDSSRFVTVELMKKLGIHFDSYELNLDDKDTGKPKIGIISSKNTDGTPDIQEVNGVSTFGFLHFIASVEASDMEYAKRIELLEKCFTKVNPKTGLKELTVSGKYFILASVTTADDPNYKRVLVLEPNHLTIKEAIENIHEESKKAETSNGDRFSVLDGKAYLISQYTLLKLLKAGFEALGVIDGDGGAVGNGVKGLVDKNGNSIDVANGVLPHVFLYLHYLLTKSVTNKKIRLIANKVEDLIAKYNDATIAGDRYRKWDMLFIAELMKETHYFGVMLIDTYMYISGNSMLMKDIKVAGESAPQSVDMEVNVSNPCYMELGNGYTEVEIEAGNGFKYKTMRVKMRAGDYKNLGLTGRMLQNSRVLLGDDIFTSAVLLGEDEAKISHTPGSFENVKNISEAKKKSGKSKATLEELRKSFVPGKDCVFPEPKLDLYGREAFYFEVAGKSDEEWKVIWDPKNRVYPHEANGWCVQVGDTVLVCGDTTRKYHVKEILREEKYNHKTKKKELVTTFIKFDTDLGDKSIWDASFEGCHPSDISAVVKREVLKRSSAHETLAILKKYDYYQTTKYKESARKHNSGESNKNKIISFPISEEDLLEMVKTKSSVLLLYPVKESDDSVFSELERFGTALKNDETPDETYMIPINTYVASSVSEEEAKTKYESAAKYLKEAIEKISEVEDLNGIVVVSLSGAKAAQWKRGTQATIDVVDSIKESYILNYIALTDTPKFNKAVKREEAPDPTKLKPVSFEELLKRILTNAKDFEELKKDMHDLVSYDSNPSVPKGYTKYYDPDTKKFHIIPTFKTLKEEYPELVKTIPSSNVSVGQKLTYITLTPEETRDAEVKAIDDSNITITLYSPLGTSEKLLELKEFDYLFGTKFVELKVEKLTTELDTLLDLLNSQQLLLNTAITELEAVKEVDALKSRILDIISKLENLKDTTLKLYAMTSDSNYLTYSDSYDSLIQKYKNLLSGLDTTQYFNSDITLFDGLASSDPNITSRELKILLINKTIADVIKGYKVYLSRLGNPRNLSKGDELNLIKKVKQLINVITNWNNDNLVCKTIEDLLKSIDLSDPDVLDTILSLNYDKIANISLEKSSEEENIITIDPENCF